MWQVPLRVEDVAARERCQIMRCRNCNHQDSQHEDAHGSIAIDGHSRCIVTDCECEQFLGFSLAAKEALRELCDKSRYCIRYADGHLGEPRTWRSVLDLISNGRHWRRYGGPALMIPVRVERQVESTT